MAEAEIPMPPDGRPVAEQAALERARGDGGLRLRIVAALWERDALPTAAAQIGGYVYELADRVAAALEATPADGPELTARFLSHWRPMSPQEVCDLTGLSEAEIRRRYGDTVLVRWDARGPQEFRWGGPGPAPDELAETREIVARHLMGRDDG